MRDEIKRFQGDDTALRPNQLACEAVVVYPQI